MSLQALTALSNRYGKNPEYVLAGGGNTSYKDEPHLWVKASGFELRSITPDGFVKLRRDALSAVLDAAYSENMEEREAQVLAAMQSARCPGEEGKRPSVETLLHHILPGAYVLHLHPTLVGGMVCGRDGRTAFDRLFAADGIWIPPTMPGYYLATVLREKLAAFESAHRRAPRYVFLENHGVFTGGDTISEVD